MENLLQTVLKAYGFGDETTTVKPFGSGLINHTWKVDTTKECYILQKINDAVFKNPYAIANNIDLVENHLQLHNPAYKFVPPIPTVDGKKMYHTKEAGFFRMFVFVKNSHTIDVVKTADQAYEAASQFGKFTNLLSGIKIDALQITLPDFHNLRLRYNQFVDALANGNKNRIQECALLIEQVKSQRGIVDTFDNIIKNPAFKLRVTHHDTKISNVLFDSGDKGICVIDLDTVMPGYFISDVGDMIRTYLCPVSEEENDFDLIKIRKNFYKAIVAGYSANMSEELSEIEKQHFFYAGEFMIYMQALRFLTDHINDDVYYGAKYEGQNLVRAKNQYILLEKMQELENELKENKTQMTI
jgi:Ser/Thr protein kinase RdoA (MazF antagonist)